MCRSSSGRCIEARVSGCRIMSACVEFTMSAPPEEVRITVPPYGSTAAGAPPHYGDVPPTYEDSTDPNAAPPSYDSLYGEFRQVNNPKGLAQFFVKALGVIVGTVTAAVVIAVLNIIPLVMIVIGAVNINRCPVEHYIPVWLIVFGAFSILKSATNFYYRAQRRRQGGEHSPVENVNPNPFDGLLSCFLLVWFVVGSVWIYSVHDRVSYSLDNSNYCDQLTYVYAFVFVTVMYAVCLCTILFTCCCCCCICCIKGTQQPQQ